MEIWAKKTEPPPREASGGGLVPEDSTKHRLELAEHFVVLRGGNVVACLFPSFWDKDEFIHSAEYAKHPLEAEVRVWRVEAVPVEQSGVDAYMDFLEIRKGLHNFERDCAARCRLGYFGKLLFSWSEMEWNPSELLRRVISGSVRVGVRLGPGEDVSGNSVVSQINDPGPRPKVLSDIADRGRGDFSRFLVHPVENDDVLEKDAFTFRIEPLDLLKSKLECSTPGFRLV